MRELFDEVAGQSPLDPEEAVRRTTRGPQRKRFYKQAGVAETADGFAIQLDGKQVRTPSGRPLVAPTRDIADGIVAEWNAQGEIIDPLTMPLTQIRQHRRRGGGRPGRCGRRRSLEIFRL